MEGPGNEIALQTVGATWVCVQQSDVSSQQVEGKKEEGEGETGIGGGVGVDKVP